MTQTFGRRGTPPPSPSYATSLPPLSAHEIMPAADSLVEQDLATWKAERRAHMVPYRLIYLAAMVIGAVVSVWLPDGPALILRALLFVGGIAALTLGRNRLATRRPKTSGTQFEV